MINVASNRASMFSVFHKAPCQFIVFFFDGIGYYADIAHFETELVITGAIFFIMQAHFLVAEGFEFGEGFLECHGKMKVLLMYWLL
jgi:hypothetical protein